MQLVPQEVFLTKGIGTHTEHLISFEMALRSAGISLCNLVTVSSIFPARCQIIPKEEGLKRLHPGAVTFCVLARQASDAIDTHVSAGIGLALPKKRLTCGYISEHHCTDLDGQQTADYVEDLAVDMLNTAIGPNPLRHQHFAEISMRPDGTPDLEYDRLNITESVYKTEEGWTTVVCAAVFIL